jgi:hypothetical protein
VVRLQLQLQLEHRHKDNFQLYEVPLPGIREDGITSQNWFACSGQIGIGVMGVFTCFMQHSFIINSNLGYAYCFILYGK